MGCLCCCCPSESSQTRRQRDESRWQRRVVVTEEVLCPFCRTYVERDVFFQRHMEECEARQERERQNALRERSKQYARTDGGRDEIISMKADEVVKGDNVPLDDLCVVCMERRRVCAFLPCGHSVSCYSCAELMETCPVCRSEITGLCRIYPEGTHSPQSDLRCKHCHAFVLPTLFDGHQEVCALRQMNLRREKEQEAAAAAAAAAVKQSNSSSGNLNGQHDSSGAILQSGAQSNSLAVDHLRCLECGQHVDSPALHMVVTEPCGHVVLCENCVQKRTTCPLCCSAIKKHTKVYH